MLLLYTYFYIGNHPIREYLIVWGRAEYVEISFLYCKLISGGFSHHEIHGN